jgi:hypothetical protein
MNFFSRLFGSNKNSNVDAVNPSANQEKVVDESNVEAPSVELFIDSEQPQHSNVVQPTQQSKITWFLDRNHHALGIRDGYEYRSSETLDTGKRKMRAEFQLILDRQIQEKQQKRLQLEHLAIDVTAVSPLTLQKLQKTIADLDTSIELLYKQKELSIENEGWVMNAIHSYHQGFTQGLNDYIAGEELLNSINNI